MVRAWARPVSAALVALAVAYAPSASAQDAGDLLDEATERLEALRYDEARAGFFAVVASGSADSEQLAQAYFNLGVVEAALNNGTSSVDAFYLALMIQPSLALGLGGSPKIRVFLNQARDRIIAVGALESRLQLQAGALTVHIDNDPLQLVKAIVVNLTAGDDESGKVTLEPGSATVEVSDEVEAIEVVLYDEAGNQLKSMTAEPDEVSSGPEVSEGVGAWDNWGLWTGLAAAGVGSSAYFFMKASDRGDQIDSLRAGGSDDVTLLNRLDKEQGRAAGLGLVSLSLAGAAAAAAGAIWFMDDSSAGEEDEAAVLPLIGPDNLGASFYVKF